MAETTSDDARGSAIFGTKAAGSTTTSCLGHDMPRVPRPSSRLVLGGARLSRDPATPESSGRRSHARAVQTSRRASLAELADGSGDAFRHIAAPLRPKARHGSARRYGAREYRLAEGSGPQITRVLVRSATEALPRRRAPGGPGWGIPVRT